MKNIAFLSTLLACLCVSSFALGVAPAENWLSQGMEKLQSALKSTSPNTPAIVLEGYAEVFVADSIQVALEENNSKKHLVEFTVKNPASLRELEGYVGELTIEVTFDGVLVTGEEKSLFFMPIIPNPKRAVQLKNRGTLILEDALGMWVSDSVDPVLQEIGIADSNWADWAPELVASHRLVQTETGGHISAVTPPQDIACQSGGNGAWFCSISVGGRSCSTFCNPFTSCACCYTVVTNGGERPYCDCFPNGKCGPDAE